MTRKFISVHKDFHSVTQNWWNGGYLVNQLHLLLPMKIWAVATNAILILDSVYFEKHCWRYFVISRTQLVELVMWQRYAWISILSLSHDLKP